MYNLSRNNYHQKPKASNIQTPLEVSQFIYKLLRDKIWDWRSIYNSGQTIFDPCCGEGNLLKTWKENEYPVLGMDLDPTTSADIQGNFLTFTENDIYWKMKTPELVLCNPPFNGYGNKLGSEVWLDKIIELFGKDIPIVLFAPIGFRLNLTTKSPRWQKFGNGKYPSISSIISLPKNIFPEVVFHSEILIFNIKDLQPHYFYHE